MSPYRTNAREGQQDYVETWQDRLSMRLVGHPCLFTNVATALVVGVPLWSVLAPLCWLVYACFR